MGMPSIEIPITRKLVLALILPVALIAMLLYAFDQIDQTRAYDQFLILSAQLRTNTAIDILRAEVITFDPQNDQVIENLRRHLSDVEGGNRIFSNHRLIIVRNGVYYMVQDRYCGLNKSASECYVSKKEYLEPPIQGVIAAVLRGEQISDPILFKLLRSEGVNRHSGRILIILRDQSPHAFFDATYLWPDD